MAKNYQKKQTISLGLEELKKAREFTIPKLSMPLSLDKYFHDCITDIHLCLSFLDRFSDVDDNINKLIEIYKNDANKFATSFSLDKLCEESGMDKGVFRRLLISTIDFLCTDDADMAVRLSKGVLVRKSLAVAMDETLPDSFEERKGWLELMGYRVTNKNNQLVSVNLNQDNTTNIQNNVIAGLPSFASVIADSEKVVTDTVKQLIDKEKYLPAPQDTIDTNTEEEEFIDVEVESKKIN